MQQHVIDISIIRELEPTPRENYLNVDTLLETLGNKVLATWWEGGKTAALSEKKKKTESRDRA